ncbi:3410_t:CDS:2 [Gigaspora margarita]|uniref:3410_t:CDS:1 n=1 Tax=Gigaspora margarita TaxID=4874 RepID=A0ABN7W3J5_GIGMA|nr:3410_t:CDS:2 [Gigaspora margarita]
MKNINIYLKISLIPFAFILQNCSIVYAQICSKINPINCLQFEPLARLWNVPNEAVPKLLDLEKYLISIDSKLQPLLNGSYFGGTYLDIKAGKINVNTVDQSKVDGIRKKLKNYQDYLNFIAVNNTLSQLNSTFNQTFILAQQLNITNCIISIEPEFNNVVIYLRMDDGNNKEFIEKVETFNPSPIIKLLPNEDNEEILFNSSTLVEKRNLYTLVDGGSPINDHLIGPMDARVIRLYDMGFIRRTNPNIFFRPVIRQLIREISQFVQLLIVGSSEITSCGTHICKAGQSTGITCGFVSAFTSVGIYDHHLRVRTFIVPMDNAPGDSGGSMFRYNGHNNESYLADAVGIYVGGIFGRMAMGMSMTVAYELGYSLITAQY